MNEKARATEAEGWRLEAERLKGGAEGDDKTSMWVLVIFFCSGATALVYELVWSKYLSLMLGSTVQAQTVVLAVFMGGLALGNRLLGKRSKSLKRPLAAYGYLELFIGLFAFFFSQLFRWADALFIHLGPGILDRPGVLLLTKGCLSVGLLLLPTMAMGGTLPVLAAWLDRTVADAGRRTARLYALNSLGAVVGSGVAGFFLVRWVGLEVSLELTAFVNLLVGLIALMLDRRAKKRDQISQQEGANRGPAQAQSALSWACLWVAISGGVSMGLEVLASRSLALLFGSSLQAFATVLMAFILGISLGSLAIASRWARRWSQEATTPMLLLGAAGGLGLLIATIEGWVDFYRITQSGLARSETGYYYHLGLTACISMVVLGVPAALLGAVLPLWMRDKDEADLSLGDRVGRLLTWNTCGAVIGVLLTGFVFMPRIGLRGSFGLLAIALSTVALAQAALQRRPVAAVASVTLAGLLGVTLGVGGEGWRHVMSSGVFRARETEVDLSVMEQRKQHVKILFYEDAADATVTVTKGDGKGATEETVLCINGKPDASSQGDLATQYLVGHLPLLARPDSRDVFVVGLGSGITAGAVLGHPVRRLVVAENCEPVIRAARLFSAWNQGVLTNTRATLLCDDARTVLKLSRQTYDVIINEPSNPWFAGIGSVFSREFYELLASRLNEGGLVAQWLQVYETSDEIVALVLRSFQSVFPNVEVWDTCGGDLVLLGSLTPWPTGPEVWRAGYQREQPRRNLERIGLPSPEVLWTRQLASQRTAFAIPGPGPVQSDEYPRIEYDAPKAFYLGRRARLLTLFDERTTQARLAPAAKRAALAQLPAGVLGAAFGQFQSVNPEVQQCVGRLVQAAEHPAYRELLLASLPTPTLFVPGSPSNELAQLPAGQPPVQGRLSQAREKLAAGSADWEQGAALVEEVIRGLAQTGSLEESRLAGAYAAAAGRVSLEHGDAVRAERLLALGLTVDPGNLDLSYLRRIVARERN